MVRPSARRRDGLWMLAVLLCAACAARGPQVAAVPPPMPAPAPALRAFEATAYSIDGETASGAQAREGICAADPDHLPLGSRIRIHDAGEYSGECLIADTGRTIKGREIDIFVDDDAEAKRFGRRSVQVEILETSD